MGIPYRFDPLGTLGASPLPPGYKRAIYLRSSADQYINTGVSVTPQTRVMLDVEFLVHNKGSYNGVLSDNPTRRFTVSAGSGNKLLYLACGPNTTNTGILAINERRVVVLSADGTATVDGTAVELDAGPPAQDVFWLFARWQAGGNEGQNFAYYATQKLYRFKMWIGEDLKLDMVPAVRLADGKPCMVDVLTGTPYFNQRNNADFTTNFDE